ncbi:hypothetical protein [Rhodoplanes sp. Z2-YC6860]|uniref:hypothetical protein n=1 Tax=Rhodoplanes sp. Z2-YC6860 TaxID=674703 RepID=UPI00078EEE6E|nr:hypothetical protein [Rhodoplanes sp. Z2-YC6860]AMN43758.1 HPr kinase [Rhodoplanes sp. Z2-YC6860]
MSSELEIPNLASAPIHATRRPDVCIRRAAVQRSLDAADPTASLEWEYDGNEFLLNISNVARFLITPDEIVVDEAPQSDPGDVSAYLLGTVFGVLCHRRGITPLHACSIETANGCVAFVGPSGAGKSTLASVLAARNHNVIADDVCFLSVVEGGQIHCWPGVNRLRLWEDAMKSLGRDPETAEREFRGYNKYLVPLGSPKRPEVPRRLRAVYQLEPATEKEEQSAILRLSGSVAFEAVMQNIYRLNIAELMGLKPNLFKVGSTIANHVPIFQFRRPMNYGALSSAIDVLEDHLRQHG